ncbi:hypothetical protein RHGRI_028967 [Rhododendron griersonianum]|uniref:Uncharacterized protein n=1 Tax=Rhododendron griersonianum TaxID=479676 RepID=A0AAV6ILI5_9ERIC|nr:hypothetical protein RHGRI_028967 [Rhododendron griersonianum]
MDSLGTDTSRSTVASIICDRLDQGRSIMSGPRIPKEDLRWKITMPLYLCLAISDAMMSNDAAFGNHHQASGEVVAAVQLLESPLVVLINSRSM